MDNELFKIMDGGYAECSPLWNENSSRRDHCYKIYFPISGHAKVNVDHTWYDLVAGNIYFINGFLLDQNQCDDYMTVYWLHFIPQSLYLSMQLHQLPPVYCWEQPVDLIQFIDPKFILTLFDHPNPLARHNTLNQTISLSVSLKANALIALLVSLIMEQIPVDHLPDEIAYRKLKGSIDFMDQNFSQNLLLEDIAKKAFLNPVYFLRLFKKTFQMTPHHYLQTKRLNEACSLLKRTDLSLQEISDRLGYCNQFYFSKVFKDYYHKTPSTYRQEAFFF